MIVTGMGGGDARLCEVKEVCICDTLDVWDNED